MNNPIRHLADCMAELTLCLVEAEREKAKAEDRADQWYENWKRADEEMKDLRRQLAAETAEHAELREKLQHFIDNQGEHHDRPDGSDAWNTAVKALYRSIGCPESIVDPEGGADEC